MSSNAAGSDGRALEGIRVLLVEGHHDSLEATTMILRHAGAQVFDARSASAALELLHGCVPDVVVSELNFGAAAADDDGFTLVRALRASPTLADVPALAVTSSARSSDRIAAIEAGYQMHISKPSSPAQLVEAISFLVRLRDSRRFRVAPRRTRDDE